MVFQCRPKENQRQQQDKKMVPRGGWSRAGHIDDSADVFFRRQLKWKMAFAGTTPRQRDPCERTGWNEVLKSVGLSLQRKNMQ